MSNEGKFMKKNILELLIKLLDSSSDLVMICDTTDIKNFNIVYVNELMAKGFQTEKNKLIGKNFWDLIPKHVGDVRRKQALQVIKTKKPLLFEDERLGRKFINHYIPIFDEKHNVIYGATITRDITRKNLLRKIYCYFLITWVKEFLHLIKMDESNM